MVKMAALALALVVLLYVPAAAAQQDVFEVVVAGVWAPEACLIVPRLFFAVQWFNPDRLEIDVANDTPLPPPVRSIASADHRAVFGLVATNRVIVSRLSPHGARTPFFEGLPGTIPMSIAVAQSGRVFVRYNMTGVRRIAVISAAGVLEATHALPNQTAGTPIAVAGNGCTIFYGASGVIARFDACTGAALSDFAVAAATDFALLPDGGAIVTSGTDVQLYNAGGIFERTIANVAALGMPAGYSASQVAVSPDGERLYVTATGICTDPAFLLEVAVEDGRLLSRRELTMHGTFDIVAGAGQATIPATSEIGLLVLAVTLALAAISILKR